MAWDTFLANAKARGVPLSIPQLKQGYAAVPVDASPARYEECLACIHAQADARMARIDTIRSSPRVPWARYILPATENADTFDESSMALEG